MNCAEPAKTIIDITIAATAESPASRATMPKETATRKPAIANGTPSLSPSRKRARGDVDLGAWRSPLQRRTSRAAAGCGQPHTRGAGLDGRRRAQPAVVGDGLRER